MCLPGAGARRRSEKRNRMSKARIGAAHIIVGGVGAVLLMWAALPLK